MIGGSGCGSGHGPGCGCVLGCWCGAGPGCGPGPGPGCGWLGLGLGLGPSSMVGPGPGCVAGHCWGLVVAIHHGHRRFRCHRRSSRRHYRHRKPWLAIASHGWTTAIAVFPHESGCGGVGRGGCTRGILAAPPPPPHSRCRHRRSRSCSLLERMLAIAVIGPGWLAGPGPCWLAGPGPCCLAGHGWLAGWAWLAACKATPP